MTKDEMKNRISMALKDPILQQGFEIICKENRELKKHFKINDKAYNDLQGNNESLRKQLNDFGYTKLEEARSIIREFVEWANWQSNSKCPSFKSIQYKAEQFLKENK